MPTELERENLHNLDVGDDYHLQGDAKWETERKRVERERLQASRRAWLSRLMRISLADFAP